MKSQISSIVCLLIVSLALVSCAPSQDERSKRSVILTAPLVAAPAVVHTAPAVVHSSVVHTNPTTVVKTEQVRSGDHSSYSYSTETKTQPIVHTHAAVAAAPVVATHAVATHAVVPAASYYSHPYGYYPTAYAYNSYYSPYSYVLGK